MTNYNFDKAESFLVMRLGAIGDVLRTLPAVRRLRVERPNAIIGWAIEDWAYPIVANNPNVDRFHILKRKQLGKNTAVREVFRFIKELRRSRYDVVLDFHGRLKSGIFSFLSGSRNRIGFVKGQCTEHNHIFNNHLVQLDDPLESRIYRFLHLLEPLGISTDYNHLDPGIHIPDVDATKAGKIYQQLNNPVLAAYPGCSLKQASYHRWPAEKWVQLINDLGAMGIKTVLFWGPDERELTEKIADNTKKYSQLAPPTNLLEMLALLGHFKVFVGGNTAAMHMAWMQGVAVAVFVGPAQSRTDAPLPPVPSRVLRADDFAQPGRSKRFQSDVTQSVTVAEVRQAVVDLLTEVNAFEN